MTLTADQKRILWHLVNDEIGQLTIKLEFADFRTDMSRTIERLGDLNVIRADLARAEG